MGIRRELVEVRYKIETDEEGVLVGRIIIGKEVWRILGIYVRRGEMDTILEVLDRWAEEKEEGIRTIVGGD